MATDEKVLRVSQLDSLEMDNELMHAMQENFLSIFRQLPNPSLFETLRPELKSILKFFLLKWSLGSNDSLTFGQNVMSLKYVHQNGLQLSQATKWLLILMYVGPGWLAERHEVLLNKIFPSFSFSSSSKLTNFIKTFINICSLINFCSFLLHGRYPSLKERFLRLKTIPLSPQTLRELSFHYMNREILWFGFTEFLFTVLPILNIRSLQNYARKALYSVIKKETRGNNSSNNICILCNCDPVLPQMANCGHVFCYYCIAANVLADEGFPCPSCNIDVTPFYHYSNKVN